MKTLRFRLIPVLLLAPFFLAGAEFRVATVDLEKVFNSYYKTKIIDNEFQEQSNVYRNYIARQAELLRKDELQSRKLLDSSANLALSAEEREKRRQEAARLEEQLRTRRAELEQYAAERAKALQESAANERRKVIDEIRDEVRRRAAIGGYQLVLDSSGRSFNDTSIVLYSVPAIDLTEQAITELNRGAAKSAPAAGAAPKTK